MTPQRESSPPSLLTDTGDAAGPDCTLPGQVRRVDEPVTLTGSSCCPEQLLVSSWTNTFTLSLLSAFTVHPSAQLCCGPTATCAMCLCEAVTRTVTSELLPVVFNRWSLGLTVTPHTAASASCCDYSPHTVCASEGLIFRRLIRKRKNTFFTLLDSAMACVVQHEPIRWRARCDGWGEAPHWEVAEMFTWSISSSVDVLLAIRRPEYRPAIDEANSLVPHSPPSKPPLNAHRHEWVAPHTGSWGSHTFCLYADIMVLVSHSVLWRRSVSSLVTDEQHLWVFFSLKHPLAHAALLMFDTYTSVYALAWPTRTGGITGKS